LVLLLLLLELLLMLMLLSERRLRVAQQRIAQAIEAIGAQPQGGVLQSGRGRLMLLVRVLLLL